jgi:exosortase K
MNEGKEFIVRNATLLLLVLGLAVGLKYHYSKADSEDLDWILRPTAELVEQISGIPFEKEAHAGFLSYAHRIVIAPACAGINFLIVAFCMAAFAGLHCIQNQRLKWLWLGGSLITAYGLTVLVNAVRIVLSIYSYDAGIYSGWITLERMHRLQGVVIYFFVLCLFYRIITTVLPFTRKKPGLGREEPARADAFRAAPAGPVPLFWYALITLVIPVLNGAISKDAARFVEHAAILVLGCVAVSVVLSLLHWAWENVRRHTSNEHETQ